MRIGLSYDLRPEYRAAGYSEEETAEFDQEDTIEAVERALDRLGFSTERIGNVRQLAACLVAGDTWDLVFNLAEGLAGFGREAQVPALLDAYEIPYTFSDPLVMALSLHKGMTKRVVGSLGVPTPDFTVVHTAAECQQIALPLPLFAKPVAEGSSKGVSTASVIRTPEALRAVCRDLLEAHRQPVLVESFLPGRELTVGLVGTGSNARALGVMEVLLLSEADRDGYSYANKVHHEGRVDYRLVDGATATRATEIALKAWRGLGCRDAGRIDLRCDAGGQPCFLEVNPLPGLHPKESDLPILCNLQGISYGDLVAQLMESALERVRCDP